MKRDEIKELIGAFVRAAQKAAKKLESSPSQPVVDFSRKVTPDEYRIYITVYRKDMVEWAELRARLLVKLLEHHKINGGVVVTDKSPKIAD